MTTQVDTFTIPRIEGNVSGEAVLDELNAPIEAIEDALNNLSGRIGGLDNKSALIRHYVPISTTVGVGSLVYYNTTTATFEPALAALEATPGDQGESIEAPISRVEGLIVATDTSGTTGTMLCGGYWESVPVTQACLGPNAVAGTYYLSHLTAGKALQDTAGHLRQAVLSYYGNGKLNLNVFYSAHDNHFHGSLNLNNSWEAVATFSDDTVTPPSNATWYYNGSYNDYEGLGELSATTTAIFHNGALLTDNSFVFVDQGYLWATNAITDEDSFTIFNHYPFAYGSPVIRSIETTTDSLNIVNRNGVVQINPNSFISGSVAKNALAVTAIADNLILYTPVVTGVSAGAGIDLFTDIYGNVTVSSKGLIGSLMSATSINHNGTNVTSDGIYTYITFPKGRNSSLVMSMPVRGIASDTIIKANAWGSVVSSNASFNVKFYFVAQPTASTPTSISTAAIATGTMAGAASSGKVVLVESNVTASFTGEGTLFAEVFLTSAPSNDIRLLDLGFKLQITNTVEAESEDDNTIPVAVLKGTGTAGYTVSKYDLLYVSGSSLQLCRSNMVASADACVGISLNSGAVGSVIHYAITGVIQDPSFNFTPGLPVFVGTNGKLTQTDPSAVAAYVQKVGTALTSAAVQFDISPAVLMED